MNTAYAHPDVLVSTAWVADHMNDPKVKLVEVDVDTTSYEKGHLKGAIGWNWQTELQDRVVRDVVDPRTFAELCRRSGINPQDTVVIYGDNNNWFAAWALWQLEMYGHRDVRLMDGGRKKWLAEGREVSLDRPERKRTEYRIGQASMMFRAASARVARSVASHARSKRNDVASSPRGNTTRSRWSR